MIKANKTKEARARLLTRVLPNTIIHQSLKRYMCQNAHALLRFRSNKQALNNIYYGTVQCIA
jgi:hypothetical protein